MFGMLGLPVILAMSVKLVDAPMIVKFSPARNRPMRGFTLTELAIVLAVVGVILGAIWVAASKVGMNNKAQRSAAEILQIVDGYRSLYSTRGIDVASATDVTCIGVDSGFFPQNMVVSTCTSGTNTTYPRPSWGGSSYVSVTANPTYQGILVTIGRLDKAACNMTMNAISASPDIIYQRINTVNQYLPPFASNSFYTTSDISDNCTSASSNTIGIMFNAR